MRLWKGLFYCYWMSDKPLVQEELAESISSMVAIFQTTQNSLGFIRAFAKTFQREWNRVDRWRMDKTMMFVRRFLRHSIRLVAKAEWEDVLLEAFIDVIKKEVVLTDPANASLGFQLHFTDVFLEEVAKVGGESLPAKVVGKLVQPWVELVATSTDLRLIEHSEERIFNHLLRQSDPGIKYQMEEDGLEEEGEEGAKEGAENGHENGAAESDDEEENIEAERGAEDPRAGRVSVVIPQVAVDYLGIADNLFELGSKEGMRKSNRDMLYRVSKKFKDVAANIFPLGPNLEELEAIEIPKVSVRKSAAELAKRQAQIRKENLDSKKRAKKAKLKEKDAPAEEETEEVNGNDEVSDDGEECEEVSLNLKAGESDEEKNGVEDESTEKKVKRENQKKKKQERKRKKREALLKASLEKAEQEKKVANQLGHDLEINSALIKKNPEAKEKKRKHDAPGPISNGHSSPAKKARIANAESNMVVILDGQSIARGRDSQCLNLTPQKKLSVALDHFERKGFKVSIFLPKTEVGPKSLSLQSRVTRNVKKVMKLTGKFVPDDEHFSWGMDKREVGVNDVKKWNLWYRCAFSRSDVAFTACPLMQLSHLSYMIQE